MPTSTDHRRATAERNAVAILDAAERLLARAEPLTMVAVATESGLSRPTVYAHFKSVSEIVEAAAERTVIAATAAFAAARPDEGPAGEALARMVAASWQQLAGSEGFVRRASQYVSEGARHRTHGALIAPLEAPRAARARGGRVPVRRARGLADHACTSGSCTRPPITPWCTTPRARRR